MTAESNRQAMPTVAKIVDEFRKHFGQVKVTYAKENGKELGKKEQSNE